MTKGILRFNTHELVQDFEASSIKMLKWKATFSMKSVWYVLITMHPLGLIIQVYSTAGFRWTNIHYRSHSTDLM
jgi:hypothetical protein